jgi:hypothetical protein
MTRLAGAFGSVAALAAVGFAVIMATSTTRQQEALWIELGKGLVQVLVIGVAASMLKLIADHHLETRKQDEKRAEDERRRQDERAEFRSAVHRRLVAATNAIRRAPILIEANRSVRTWSAEMLEIVDAGFELRLIRHEISSSRQAPDPPFNDEERDYIEERIGVMLNFVEAVAADFAAGKKELSEQQLEAERPDLSPRERKERQAAVWEALSSRWPVRDLRGDALGPDERPEGASWRQYRDAYEEIVDATVRTSLAPA